MELCCGALVGMGESDAQRVELLAAAARARTRPRSRVNFLNPRPGTPLGDRQPVGAWEAIRWIALFRLGLPGVILRYAGGREVTLRDLQAMGMTVGNQRADRRQLPDDPRPLADEDLRMLEDLRMPVGALTGALTAPPSEWDGPDVTGIATAPAAGAPAPIAPAAAGRSTRPGSALAAAGG